MTPSAALFDRFGKMERVDLISHQSCGAFPDACFAERALPPGDALGPKALQAVLWVMAGSHSPLLRPVSIATPDGFPLQLQGLCTVIIDFPNDSPSTVTTVSYRDITVTIDPQSS